MTSIVPRLVRALSAVAFFAPIVCRADETEPRNNSVSFRNDVLPILSKSGCNAGACHGNQNGKGGFKLSLRAEDPKWDLAALSRDLSGRRLNRVQPERSLLLLKPAGLVAHEGGRRFIRESDSFRTLHAWIAAGCPDDSPTLPHLRRLDVQPTERVVVEPDDSVSLHVDATYSDGRRVDATKLAVFESSSPLVDISADGIVTRYGRGEVTIIVRFQSHQVPVRLAFVPARPDFAWNGPPPANFIDEQVFAKLRSLRVNPSSRCSDSEFVRRVYFDLLGMPPTADEARRFVADERADKRTRWVDDLLQRPEFATLWALKWADLLRVEEKTLDRKGVQNFHAWLRQQVAVGTPIDQFARDLIAARGSTYAQPASNYYRALRQPTERAETTAQVFLGVRLQCAKCHNHPFDRWTQDDYYGWANLFARVQYKIIENRRRDRNDSHEFDGEQIVYTSRDGDLNDPRTALTVPPRFLSDDRSGPAPYEDRLIALAEWCTRTPQFAATQVNRVWFHLLGRGIVDPIDDFRASNPPSNPALLDALAAWFSSGPRPYDLRDLIRVIAQSETYQRSAEPNGTNADDKNFSRAIARRLPAEQLLDAASVALGVPASFKGYPIGIRAGELPGVRAIRSREQPISDADRFLVEFGKPPRLQACECERSDTTTLAQTFQMVSGPFINELIARPGNRLDRLLTNAGSTRTRVDELYWWAVSRAPTPIELDTTARYVDAAADLRRALEDVAWALLNSHEFMLRH